MMHSSVFWGTKFPVEAIVQLKFNRYFIFVKCKAHQRTDCGATVSVFGIIRFKLENEKLLFVVQELPKRIEVGVLSLLHLLPIKLVPRQ